MRTELEYGNVEIIYENGIRELWIHLNSWTKKHNWWTVHISSKDNSDICMYEKVYKEDHDA